MLPLKIKNVGYCLSAIWTAQRVLSMSLEQVKPKARYASSHFPVMPPPSQWLSPPLSLYFVAVFVVYSVLHPVCYCFPQLLILDNYVLGRSCMSLNKAMPLIVASFSHSGAYLKYFVYQYIVHILHKRTINKTQI